MENVRLRVVQFQLPLNCCDVLQSPGSQRLQHHWRLGFEVLRTRFESEVPPSDAPLVQLRGNPIYLSSAS